LARSHVAREGRLMHYVAIVGGQERQIEITEVAPDLYQVLIDGQRHELDARPCGPTTWAVLAGTRAWQVEMETTAAGQVSHLGGHAIDVEVLDLRRMRLRRAQEGSAGPDGPAAITAPMPGKVVAVLVKEGDTVVAGQGLIVVEAMKMENELRAPKAGVVRHLKVNVGAAVESGAKLCVIE
jgi:biotin carboxyl carrier protein